METEADRSTEAGIGFAERGQPTHLTGSSSSGSSSAISLAYPACFSLTDLDGPASAAAALSFCSLAISSSSSVAGGASPLKRRLRLAPAMSRVDADHAAREEVAYGPGVVRAAPAEVPRA
jgi:hypothetical protein